VEDQRILSRMSSKTSMNCVAILFLWLLSLIALISTRETIPVDHDLFRIGAAKKDITGPAAEVGMMGKVFTIVLICNCHKMKMTD
jgi:hypothetical protein